MKEMDSFVFYRTWREAIKCLPDQSRLMLYEAIMDYAFADIIPDEDPFMMALFNMAKMQIDSDKSKYQNRITGNAKGGSKHTGNQYTRRKAEAEKKDENGSQLPMEDENGSHGRNGTDNVNYNVNYNDSTIVEYKEPNKLVSSSTEKVDVKKRRGFGYKEFLEFYNKKAEGKLPMAQKLGDKRKGQLHARFVEYGLDVMKEAVEKACQSTFLIERNFGLDWIMQQDHFSKVVEGYYDKRNQRSEGTTESRKDADGEHRHTNTGTPTELKPKKLTKEEEQEMYIGWALDRGLDPDAVETGAMYSDFRFRS